MSLVMDIHQLVTSRPPNSDLAVTVIRELEQSGIFETAEVHPDARKVGRYAIERIRSDTKTEYKFHAGLTADDLFNDHVPQIVVETDTRGNFQQVYRPETSTNRRCPLARLFTYFTKD